MEDVIDADDRQNKRGVLTTIWSLFLGHAPNWYKLSIVTFLIINPIVLTTAGPFTCGWLLLLEFIFTLALALKCYPLQPGGLLAIEAVLIGLASPEAVYHETETNFPVILLLMFMVAGIYFLRDLLIFIFSKLFLYVENKTVLALLFCAAGAVISAFLDALTVVAVIITVATGLYGVLHKITSANEAHAIPRNDLERFRGFLRSIVMHAAVGTALGGVCTLVGEPQNLLIGKVLGWDFGTFLTKIAPVSLPVLAVGLFTCLVTERFRVFGYGDDLPPTIRSIIAEHDAERQRNHNQTVTVQDRKSVV